MRKYNRLRQGLIITEPVPQGKKKPARLLSGRPVKV